MRAKAPALKTFAREAFERGVSLREIARVGDLPLGTVKAWRSRGKWQRSQNQSRFKTGALSTEDETLGYVGERRGHETRQKLETLNLEFGTGADVHRGLRACHMPGRKGSKQMTFSLFKRNLWPPAVWKVPPGLVGGELLMLLQERSCMGLVGKAARRKGKA